MGLAPGPGPAWWKIPFHSAYESFGNSKRIFWSNGTRPNISGGSLQFPKGFSGKLQLHLTFQPKFPGFLLNWFFWAVKEHDKAVLLSIKRNLQRLTFIVDFNYKTKDHYSS